MAGLVAAFVLQTALVYSDPAPGKPLDDLALRGRQAWHRHACNTCHQVHGFGGFLGPDLTNAASRLSEERLRTVLTRGAGQMPAFDLPPEEIAAVGAYLRSLDGMGRGQARHPDLATATSDPAAPLARAVAAALGASGPPDVARGLELVGSRACWACHAAPGTPAKAAPDLATARERLDEAALLAVLTNGRPEKGMPPPPLAESERRDVASFLAWLSEHRAPVLRAIHDELGARRVALADIPWWEYR
jgi:nitric oxide reductase subunit C